MALRTVDALRDHGCPLFEFGIALWLDAENLRNNDYRNRNRNLPDYVELTIGAKRFHAFSDYLLDGRLPRCDLTRREASIHHVAQLRMNRRIAGHHAWPRNA